MKYKFVNSIPDILEEYTLYITTRYNTAIHLCMCGCGNEVVTPISPNDWKLCYDGDSVSLSPSIGNWSFACQSHYWIKNSKVIWADKWSKQKIKKVREIDLKNRNIVNAKVIKTQGKESFFDKIINLLQFILKNISYKNG